LPNIKGVGEGAYHPELHTGEYYDEVERRLKTATDRERALEILQDIKEDLSKNRFPYYQIAAWTEALTRDNHGPVLIYLGERLRVRGLQSVHPDRLFYKTLMADEMPRKLIDFGVNGAVAALPCGLSNDMLDVVRGLVRSNILWAAVGSSKNGTPFGCATQVPNPDYLGGKHRSTFEPYYIK